VDLSQKFVGVAESSQKTSYPTVRIKRNRLPVEYPADTTPQQVFQPQAEKPLTQPRKFLKFAAKAIKKAALATAVVAGGALWLGAKAVEYTVGAVSAVVVGTAALCLGIIAFGAVAGFFAAFVAAPVAIGITAGVFALGIAAAAMREKKVQAPAPRQKHAPPQDIRNDIYQLPRSPANDWQAAQDQQARLQKEEEDRQKVAQDEIAQKQWQNNQNIQKYNVMNNGGGGDCNDDGPLW
jgi:hypothetical protein